jgi:hypothetical protein
MKSVVVHNLVHIPCLMGSDEILYTVFLNLSSSLRGAVSTLVVKDCNVAVCPLSGCFDNEGELIGVAFEGEHSNLPEFAW